MAYVLRTRPGDAVTIDGPAVIRHERSRRRRRRRHAEHVLVIEAAETTRVRLDKRRKRV